MKSQEIGRSEISLIFVRKENGASLHPEMLKRVLIINQTAFCDTNGGYAYMSF